MIRLLPVLIPGLLLPFYGVSYYRAVELAAYAGGVPTFSDFLDWIFYATLLLGGYSIIWAIGKVVRKRSYTRNGVSGPTPKSTGLHIFLNTMGVLGLAIVGGYAGFWLGWGFGRMAGYTGGESIGTIMMAIVGVPIGAILGIFLGIVVIRTTRLQKNTSTES